MPLTESIIVIIREEMEYEQVGWVGRPIAFSPSQRDADKLIDAMERQQTEWRTWLTITAAEQTAAGEYTTIGDVDDSDRGFKRRQMMIDRYASVDAQVRYTTKEISEEIAR